MVLVGVIIVPNMTLAQPYTLQTNGLFRIINILASLLSALVPLLIALAIVYLVYGIVMYVIGDSEEAKTKGRDTIIFGIIGLAVIVSVWGLVRIVQETFQLDVSKPQVDSIKNLLP